MEQQDKKIIKKFFLSGMFWGFIIGGIASVIVTLMDKAPSAEVEAIYAIATDDSIDD